MDDPVLRMENISKYFPGVAALRNVNFSLKKGEVHVLLGENGAGKSTLMHILYGSNKPDSGDIYFEGQKVKISSPKFAEKLGIAMVHQDPGLVPDFNTVENIFLGREITIDNRLGCLDLKRMQNESKQYLDSLGAEVDLDKKVRDMNMTEKQFVSIARALAADPKIIIFDEPTASLTDLEIARLFELIRELKAKGRSIVYISHRLKELKSFCDRVTVLKDGQVIATQYMENVEPIKIIKMMMGKDIKDYYPKLPVDVGPEVLRVSNLFTNAIKNVSFELHKGEILGVAGLVGSGRTNLARTIFGLEPLLFGKIIVNGSEKKIRSARDAIHAGIGFVSENRNEQGLFNILSVSENTSISSLKSLTYGSLISIKKEKRVVKDVLKRLGIKDIRTGEQVLFQSGGNKQKVILARWLLSRSQIFIFDEPTHGLDVQSKVEAYNLMNEIVKNGGSILMISSDISELVGMSNRIIILNKGQLIGEFDRNEATQEKIFFYASGGSL